MENNIKEVIESIDVPMEKLNFAIEKGMGIQKKKRQENMEKSHPFKCGKYSFNRGFRFYFS